MSEAHLCPGVPSGGCATAEPARLHSAFAPALSAPAPGEALLNPPDSACMHVTWVTLQLHDDVPREPHRRLGGQAGCCWRFLISQEAPGGPPKRLYPTCNGPRKAPTSLAGRALR